MDILHYFLVIALSVLNGVIYNEKISVILVKIYLEIPKNYVYSPFTILFSSQNSFHCIII